MPGPRVQCGLCNTIIQSKHRHDFVGCKCNSIMIDGGSDYTRFLWASEEAYAKAIWLDKEEENAGEDNDIGNRDSAGLDNNSSQGSNAD